MKYLTIILLINSFVFAQTNDPKDVKIRNLQKQNIELNKRVDMLEKQGAQQNIKLLEDRIEQASNTISNQDVTMNSHGYFYGAMAILITLFSVGIPLWINNTVKLPAERFLREIETKMDLKIEEYLQNSRMNARELALKELNQEVIQNSIGACIILR